MYDLLEFFRKEIFMGAKTDIEIAQECTPLHITEIAKKAGICSDGLGNHSAWYVSTS